MGIRSVVLVRFLVNVRSLIDIVRSLCCCPDLLKELHRKEKELGIHPEADVDYYMKVSYTSRDRQVFVSPFVYHCTEFIYLDRQ
jgi:hypothetical protein